MSLKKAEVLMRGLKEKLQFRLPSTYIFADSVDGSSNPVLTIQQDSSWATGEQKVVIRIKPEATLFVNSLGLAQEGFGPHICQLVSEESASAGESELNDSNALKIMREVFAMGCIVEWYLNANATEPAVAQITSANLEFRLDDLQYPVMNAV